MPDALLEPNDDHDDRVGLLEELELVLRTVEVGTFAVGDDDLASAIGAVRCRLLLARNRLAGDRSA